MSLFFDDASSISEPFLRRAASIAALGRGSVSPNPMVGCVLVRDGIVVGEGYHHQAGSPHAEALALEAAGESARGATAYVTLEPCAHYGKTPPCANALIKAGVTRVVIGMRDPNPEVSGGGADVLAAAGVEVVFAADDAPFLTLNEAWLHRIATERPFVRVKGALTLDGRPALYASKRSRITGEGGSALTMQLRAAATAVAVGAATLDVDDPALTVRDERGRTALRQPIRVVLSRTSVPRRSASVFASGAGSSIVVTSEGADPRALAALESLGVGVVRYDYVDGIDGALRALARAGIDDLLIEAGPTLMSALWSAGVVDELILVHAGGMGGNAAPPLYLGGPDAVSGNLRPSMHAVEAAVRGDDAITVWRPRHSVSDTHTPEGSS